jgi:hypothetical protein
VRALLRPGVFLIVALVGAVIAYAALAGKGAAPGATSAASTAPTNDPPVVRLNLSRNKGIVGDAVRASADGLPEGKTAELRWVTVTGGWVVEDYYHFRGKKYSETTSTLGRFPIDQNGHLEAQFTVPEDYGGVHDIIAAVDGRPVAQNGIDVIQSFEMTPTSGPVGTVIELKVKGLGWRTMESTWVVNWDNREVGWVSAASSRGSAVARFRAAGPAGDHPVKVYTGWQGQPYLNHEQSPVAHLPRPEFVFQTTSGRASADNVFVEPYQRQPVPGTEIKIANATLALSATQGPVGSTPVLRGTGFPAGKSLHLVWQTFVGSRVSGNGFAPEETALTNVTVGGDGRIDMPIAIPDDLGGLHALVLRDGENTLATTHFVIETSIVSMTPRFGPVGTPVTIHLKGVGWTEYDNIFVATYDNAYMGYACGFNSHGDVVINFTATGTPGPHIIDLYPGIYQGPATEQQLLYRTPQLTYADDHPGNKIPALRFTFDVTASTRNDTH